jgi:anti-sigma-K factor RskA
MEMYDDDRDALAAEYVLGTLSADERDQAEALLAIDPGFAETVRSWERRLGELNVMVEAVEPPAEVWDKIRTGIGGFGNYSAAGAESGLPAIDEVAPQTAPGVVPAPPTPEFRFDLARDLDTPSLPQDLDALSPSQDLNDDSIIATLASSLLPPEAEPKSEKSPAPEPPSPPLFQSRIERKADVIYLARKARRWRGLTAAMMAIAALLALYIGVSQFAPGLIPLGRQSQTVVASQAKPPAARLVVVLQQEPTAPAFLVTVDPQNRTLTVRRVSATAETGRSYELWVTSSKSPAPQSLGVVGQEDFTARPIPSNFDVDTMRTASYAISLEPAGGSPSGAPTGPILFTGKMVESLPGSLPPS